MDIKVYTFEEMLSAEFPKLVEVRDDEVGFPGRNYWIELKRIKGYHDLLAWVHHLSGKAWIDGEAISQFIEAVCAQKGWKIYRSGR
jgi:hypothetical protein